MPLIAAGTSGTPAASAIRAAPVRGRASNFFRSPFCRRVPSGNIATMLPSRAELDRGLDRHRVALAAPDGKGAAPRITVSRRA